MGQAPDDIDSFIQTLDHAGGFVGPDLGGATAMPALLLSRRHGNVAAWVHRAVMALGQEMRADQQPPVARGLLDTGDRVLVREAEPCEYTEWFIESLQRRASGLPTVWTALAIPDVRPWHIPTGEWNPTNTGHGVRPYSMRWFVEVRGKKLGLPGNKLLQTGRLSLEPGVHDVIEADDPGLLRLGRRILRGHPVRRR